jgi:hypothetical protein
MSAARPFRRRWLRPALRAFTSLRDVSLRRNRLRQLSLPRSHEGAPAEPWGTARSVKGAT